MRALIAGLLVCTGFAAMAQDKSPFEKFGKVETKHLEQKTYSIDSLADAVILSDICDNNIEGNSKNWFSAVIKRHTVIHILSKKGYEQGTVYVPLYHGGRSEEEISGLKGVTYNLENGKVIATKLEKSGIFQEKVDANRNMVKFTMPAMKEGSIIEYEYTVTTDYINNLDAWYFQNSEPTLWSELNFGMPEFFSYSLEGRGFLPVDIATKKQRTSSFTVADNQNAGAGGREVFSASVTDYRWVIKNAPALKEEQYISSLSNYRSRIELQQVSQSPPLQYRDFRHNWTALAEELGNSEYFGEHMKLAGWMKESAAPGFASLKTNEDKTAAIYRWVRDNFTMTSRYGVYPEQTTAQTFKSRKGSRPEINLILAGLLRDAGINAAPIILSTRAHGRVNNSYPMLTNFNMVVVGVSHEDGTMTYLDAAEPTLGYGMLLPECYNGSARMIVPGGPEVMLSPDSLLNTDFTVVFLTTTDKGLEGTIQQTAGTVTTTRARAALGANPEAGLSKFRSSADGEEFKVTLAGVDSLKNLDAPLKVTFNINGKPFTDDLIYFDPMFGEGMKKNPFNSPTRYYPIEMPFKSDDIFLLTMDIPKGYKVEELPKSLIVKIDEDNSGYFEYVTSQSGDKLSMRARLRINRTLFLPDEYESVREFYKIVTRKYNEQIVFKKIN